MIDLSFARYVAARRAAGAPEEQREGYAYGGDQRVRTALDRLVPVTVAVNATLRFWQALGKNQILGSAALVSERQFPALHAAVRRCADTLQMRPPAVYVAAKGSIRTLGPAEEALVLIGSGVVDSLSEPELLFLLGRECGHIQNCHSSYLTALYFVSRKAGRVVRWVSRPAVLALNGWSRRAEITADRAGLLCAGDLEVAVKVLVKSAVGAKVFGQIDLEDYLRQLAGEQAGVGRFEELLATAPYLPKRVEALRLFARTSRFLGGPGLSREACDAQVSELLAVLGR
jgi:Zn-dependent protease with chaperone function